MAEEVQELSQCPACFDSYEEDGDHIPRILPCHCTLCQACIGKLLKNNALECPQDRQKHKAERGVKSFSQNKYVLAYLRKDLKRQDSEYEECTEHNLKRILYCKHEKCKKALCPMCMSEQHLTHEVVNYLDVAKHQLFTKINKLMRTFRSYNETINMVKQHIKYDYERKDELLQKKRNELLENLDVKLADSMDNIVTIGDIKEKVAQSTNHKDLRDKLEFIELLEALGNETVQPLTYKFFDLVENTEELTESEVRYVSDDIAIPEEKKFEVKRGMEL